MSQVPALYIRSKHEPYRRAGFAHSRAGFGVALDALTEDQVALLKSDPHLVVEECTIDPEEAVQSPEAVAAAAKAAQEAAAAEAAAKAAAEAEKANDEALKREKAATKKVADKTAWHSAEEKAREDAGLDADAWAALPASDRVARIEVVIAEAAK